MQSAEFLMEVKMKIKIRPFYVAFIVLVVAVFFICEGLTSKSLSYNYSFVGYGGTFKNHDLKILGIPIYWFMLLTGFVITIVMSIFRRNYYKISKAKAIVLPVIFLLIGIIGGKVMYLLENFSYVKINEIKLDGMSLYGAIYLIFLIIPVIAKCSKIKIRILYDYFTSMILVILSSVRMGCFFNGCCGANIIWKNNIPIILPVQLFEVICDLVILDICLKIEKKKMEKGYLFPIFMISYGICRFLLEFLRKTPKETLFMSHGQIFSIISIVLACFWIYIYNLQCKCNSN